MRDRNKKHILTELVDEADSKYIYDTLLTSSGRLRDNERNAKLVGKLVESLSPEDREQLRDLKAEDIAQMFADFRRPRPQVPARRTRGPVTHTKSKD